MQYTRTGRILAALPLFEACIRHGSFTRAAQRMDMTQSAMTRRMQTLEADLAEFLDGAGPKILGNATTKLFEGVMAQLNNTGSIDFDYIGRIVLITLGLYLLSSLFAYIQGWIMADVSTNIAYRFRRDISRRAKWCLVEHPRGGDVAVVIFTR